MKFSVITILCCLSISFFLNAQPSDLPSDYLTKEFHAGRRDSLRALMPANSVAAVFAYPVRNFSNDVDYVFHQNPDMYYFSGYKEPNSLLLIFKEEQVAADGSKYKEVLFVQRKDPFAEQWTGVRLGVAGAKEQLGFQKVFNGDEFASFSMDFSKFEHIYFDNLPTDVADDRYDKADLFDLINLFKQKTAMPEKLSTDKRFSTGNFVQFTGKLREIKTEEELNLLRKAVEISCIGQAEVMRAIRPDMSEREIEGLHDYIHKRYGAENVGYPSIVGAGNNGCILHYIDNDKLRIGQQMLLMDVGAEYHGYTADVTRTVPANGKFSPEQKQIYELVYAAQEEAFKICKEGTSWQELEQKSRALIVDGLIKLGIAKTKEEANRYYPHGLGHHIGLDVHDRSNSSKLKKGMVITIEPGIYIPENSPCDKKWWGIAVRIEDDVLIKEKDFELLSFAAPRKIEEIEKLVAEKSPFENYTLPALKSAKKGF
jgi:Xaa-Pro aminopeptidase